MARNLISVLFILLTFFADPSAAMDTEIKWGGQIRCQGSLSQFDKPHILELAGSTGPFLDGFMDTRLTASVFVGENLTIETHYEAVLSGGETREAIKSLAESFPGVPNLATAPPSDDRRLFSLTKVMTESDSHVLYHRLDRLSATYTNERITLRMGRQALTWGNGMVFNPMDLMNPFSPSDVIRDYKIGDDMVVLQGWYGTFSDLQLVYVPRRDPETGDISGNHSSIAAKAKLTGFDSDWDILFASHYDSLVLGLGMVRYVGDAALRADVTYTHTDDTENNGDDDFFSAVVNLDYSWVWGEKNFYGMAEIYYNGIGCTDARDAAGNTELVKRIERGELFSTGKLYATGQVQFEAHPLVNLYLSAIFNLNDGSMLLQPRATWDILSSTRLLAGMNIPVGSTGTEYGGVEDPSTGKPFSPPVTLYMLLTLYF